MSWCMEAKDRKKAEREEWEQFQKWKAAQAQDAA